MKARLVRLSIVVAFLTLALSAGTTADQGPRPLPYRGEGGEGGLDAQQQAHNAELVRQIGGPVESMAVQGGYAYIGVVRQLVILDVSDPNRPVVARQTDFLPDRVQGVAVAGSYAYVASWDAGLRIINVANAAAPSEAAFYDTPGDARGVVVSGTYAYVADRFGGLVILRFPLYLPIKVYLPLVLRN